MEEEYEALKVSIMGNGTIVVDFGRPVPNMALTPDQAQDFGRFLMKMSRKARAMGNGEEGKPTDDRGEKSGGEKNRIIGGDPNPPTIEGKDKPGTSI